MPRKPTGKPSGKPRIPVRAVTTNGPPPKEIILDQVLYWIDLQATAQEIAGSFYVSVDTLDRRLKEHFGMGFADLQKRCEGSAKLSLRRYQFNMAKKNTSMAIWLGKQWLGQRENTKEELKEIVVDEVRSAIQALKADAGDQGSSESRMENESSLLYQECSREESSIQAELGSEDPLAGFAPV